MRDISRGWGCYYCRWINDERVNHNNDDDDDGRQRRRRTSLLVWCNLSNRYINALLENDNFVSVRAGWRDRSEACVPRGNIYIIIGQIKHENRNFMILSRLRNQRMRPLTFGTIIISNVRSDGDRLAGKEGVVPRYRESLEWTQKDKECWRDCCRGMRLSPNIITSVTRWWWTKMRVKGRRFLDRAHMMKCIVWLSRSANIMCPSWVLPRSKRPLCPNLLTTAEWNRCTSWDSMAYGILFL